MSDYNFDNTAYADEHRKYLREVLAGQLMQGFLANPFWPEQYRHNIPEMYETFVRNSVHIADNLIKELEQ